MDDNKKTGRFYLVFFGLVCGLFITLLGYVYHATGKANPVMLDEHGHQVVSR